MLIFSSNKNGLSRIKALLIYSITSALDGAVNYSYILAICVITDVIIFALHNAKKKTTISMVFFTNYTCIFDTKYPKILNKIDCTTLLITHLKRMFTY